MPRGETPPPTARCENGPTLFFLGLAAREVTLAAVVDSTGCWATTWVDGENKAAEAVSMTSVRQEVMAFKTPPSAQHRVSDEGRGVLGCGRLQCPARLLLCTSKRHTGKSSLDFDLTNLALAAQ